MRLRRGRVRAGWGFLRALVAASRRERALAAPSLWGVGASLLYAVALVLVVLGAHVGGDPTVIAVVGFAGAVGAWFIMFYFSAVTVVAVERWLRGAPPDLGAAARVARRRWPDILLLAVASALVDRAARRLEGSEGSGRGRRFVGQVVAGILERAWTVMGHLVLPVVVTERVSLRAALERVRQLHRGNMLRIAIDEIAAVGLAQLLALAAALVFAATVWLAHAVGGTTLALPYGLLGGFAVLIAITAWVRFVRVAYYTCLYVWAVDTERHGQGAPPPPLLASVLDDGP